MKRSDSPRMRKVNELVREVVADQVAELKDPRLGFVTITSVDTTPDLRSAKVFYSVLGEEDVRESTAAGLAAAAPRFQRAVASQTRLKYTPKLVFAVDPAIDQGIRMSELLRGLDEESEEAAD